MAGAVPRETPRTTIWTSPSAARSIAIQSSSPSLSISEEKAGPSATAVPGVEGSAGRSPAGPILSVTEVAILLPSSRLAVTATSRVVSGVPIGATTATIPSSSMATSPSGSSSR